MTTSVVSSVMMMATAKIMMVAVMMMVHWFGDYNRSRIYIGRFMVPLKMKLNTVDQEGMSLAGSRLAHGGR